MYQYLYMQILGWVLSQKKDITGQMPCKNPFGENLRSKTKKRFKKRRFDAFCVKLVINSSTVQNSFVTLV